MGILKSDVIADRFHVFRDYIVNNPEYVELASGIYVRKHSERIDLDGLAEEYRRNESREAQLN
jgi:hypothetical protein